MNITSIAGNLGQDAEVRQTQSGKSVTSFSVAVKNREETIWYNCASMNLEKLAPYLNKGTAVAVNGRLDFKKVEDGKGYYITLWVNDVTLQGGRKSDRQDAHNQAKSNGYQSDMDDQIPF